MANEFKHDDAGVELTRNEDNATDRHYCANQVAEDMFRAEDATHIHRFAVVASRIIGRKSSGSTTALTAAEVLALLSGQASAAFDLNSQKITSIAAPASSGDALIKGTRVTGAELLDGTNGYVLTAQGAGSNPIYADIGISGHASTTSGIHGVGASDIASVANIATHAALATHLVSGLILMWHGIIGNIPSGWVICDGNNSTPNLLTRFIQGVATAGTDPGATGGSASHTLSEAELASHSHTIDGRYHSASNGAYIESTDQATVSTTPSTSITGSDSAHENEPTFYDVAFIMKT